MRPVGIVQEARAKLDYLARRPPSESKHVVEAERRLIGKQAVVTEQAARRVPDQNVSAVAGSGDRLVIECFVVAPVQRAAAGNVYGDRVDNFTVTIVEDEARL